jgi:hypothetical protein
VPAISLTIDQTNLLWLKGRARVVSGGSLSEAVDQLITEARAGRLGLTDPHRSVVGTIDLPDDEMLLQGSSALNALFAQSLSRPIFAHKDAPGYRALPGRSTCAARRGRFSSICSRTSPINHTI